MEESIQFSLPALVQLIPLCLELKEKLQKKEEIDLHDAANRFGAALGIEDVDAFAVQQFKRIMEDGIGLALDGQSAEQIAAIFSCACGPVMSLLVSFAKGQSNSANVLDGLQSICAQSSEGLCSALQGALGVPDELAQMMSAKLGLQLVSVFCFAAAFKIFCKAAEDARMAREHRIEIEKLTAEAISYLKQERARMEQLVNTYMLNRLVPVREGIAAMDQAVVNDDTDGFIAANAELWKLFGRESQYSTIEEFDELMLSDETFML